jgi:hypothetical protein
MPTSIPAIAFCAGLALIIVSLLGGGIEVKEVKVPPLPLFPRAATFVVGCVLVAAVLFDTALFAQYDVKSSTGAAASTTQTDKRTTEANSPTKPTSEKPIVLGYAITNHFIEVQDVKRILRHANLFAGPLNGDPTSDYFQAVIDFQNSKHITVDGLVGGETLAKLKEAWPEYFEQSKVIDYQLNQQGQAASIGPK